MPLPTHTPVQSRKACPIVLRAHADGLDLLAFRHPLAGLQIVKGGIQPGENAHDAALHELAEESGIACATVAAHWGHWHSGHEGQVWAMLRCQPTHALPEYWWHHTNDDGGHVFAFFWQPLVRHRQPIALQEGEWHPLFIRAIGHISQCVLSHPVVGP